MDTPPTAESSSTGYARNSRLYYQKRFFALKNDQATWLSAWKDIQKYLAPTRGFFEGTLANQGAMIDHKAILDGHSSRSLNTLASGMTSGLTSPTRPWFRLSIQDPDLAQIELVKEWLGKVQDRMMTVFQKSNIYGVLNSIYSEVGAFGTASMMLVEDFETVVRARGFTIGEYYLGTGPDGRVNTFARMFKMTTSQLIKEFGEAAVSPSVRIAWQRNDADTFWDVYHLIEPNDTRVPDRKDFKNMKFRSCYWQPDSPEDTYLAIRGFDEFPVLAPRWETTTTADVYGRSPGWYALGDIKMLQKMKKTMLLALEKVADPPLQADSNVADDIDVLPGGITRSSATSPNAGLRAAYLVNPDVNAMEASIDRVKRGIDSFFYADLFMMIATIDHTDMTAREIVERHEEKLLMLGPVLEKLESELLSPLIDRTFSIMLKAGLIPEPPAELQGMDLDIEYISLLAQAQKMVGITGIEQVVRFTGSMLGAFPEVGDMIDSDESVREYANMIGVPPRMIRSPEQIAALRKQRAAAQAQAKMEQDAAAQVQGAKVLSDTPVGQNSALDLVLNQGK